MEVMGKQKPPGVSLPGAKERRWEKNGVLETEVS